MSTTPEWNSLNPFPYYEYMREHHPVYFNPTTNDWNVFHYAQVQQVLSDHANFTSTIIGGGDPQSPIAASMIANDPPRHRQLRGLVTQAFTPRTVTQLTDRITGIVQELLDRALPNGKMDAVDELAYPLPIMVIAELLGAPAEDRDRFRAWSEAIVSSRMGSSESSAPQMEMGGYFMQFIAQRRQQPTNDLMSALVAARLDGEQFNDLELLGFCILLLVAGHETTTHLLSNAIICLDEHPQAIEQLRAQPELVPAAIEEVLRYRAPVHYMIRMTTQNVNVGGQEIPAGQVVRAWIGSANRDEQVFPNAATFDINRDAKQHMGFGYGVHFCLGAPLARLESKIALTALLEKMPNFRRQREIPLQGLDGEVIFGVKHLPITF
jgi:cytochrome P450